MVKLGLPFMLEDKTGSLSNSDYKDLYDRMYLGVRCTRRESNGASQYAVFNYLPSEWSDPAVSLEYGVGGTPGAVTFMRAGRTPTTLAMGDYLMAVDDNNPRHRKFVASDGQEYRWSWRTNTAENLEWSCVNVSGVAVAWYALKIPGENYANSSGCMFGVEEPYPHLAVEFLVTFLIMRHIATHNM
ncbi:hypothetical protein BC834DRAFT_842685 [Gloeopeniophorella convolvens]|nr:hypothetical protein BC834DRAFT_842685 [Gloeopeniophorella convolvens]